MLGVNVCSHVARLLRLCDDVQRERRLARRLRPENFDYAPAGYAADAECRLEAD